MASPRQRLALDDVLDIVSQMREEFAAVKRSLERLKSAPPKVGDIGEERGACAKNNYS
jgi:hypothetical protein